MSSLILGGLEEKLIFYPIDKDFAKVRINVENQIQDTYFYSRDGYKLNAWYIKAKEDKPTVIYCHGQGENLSEWQNVAEFLAKSGYGVFMIDYRGTAKVKASLTNQGFILTLNHPLTTL